MSRWHKRSHKVLNLHVNDIYKQARGISYQEEGDKKGLDNQSHSYIQKMRWSWLQKEI